VAKIKPLLPTLKERKRYILFKIYTDSEIEKEKVSRCVAKACLQFLGELNMAKSGIQFLPETLNKTEKTGIIRTNNKYLDQVKAALTLIKDIEGKKTSFSTIKVSGSLDKLKKIHN